VSPTPRVRLVILNWNDAPNTARAVAHIEALDWPRDRLDVVVVDNASSDNSVADLRARFPQLDLRVRAENEGFAANNCAMDDLDGIDYVGLVNNDAFCDPGYLKPLVATLENNPTLGAACPKILLAKRFHGIDLRAGGAVSDSQPASVTAVLRDGENIAAQCHLAAARETRTTAPDGTVRFGLAGLSKLWIPERDSNAPLDVEMHLDVPEGGHVLVDLGDGTEPGVHHGGPLRVQSTAAAVDVVQNIGTELALRGFGRDRGYLLADEGQFDEPTQVFGWCGAGVLLRPEYLREVGLFDPAFFLYYEDLDLSWRGRALGWGYETAPTAVLRHAHATSTVQGSADFNRYQIRNRLVAVTKNASTRVAGRAFVRSFGRTAQLAVSLPLNRSRHNRSDLLNRLRAQREALAMLGSMVSKRRQINNSRRVSARELEDFANR
jgi:GT2 family glycosyltransferase